MIIDHDRYQDEIGAYLLGALGDEEAATLERHIDSCASCRRELARLQIAADALPRAVEPLEPPPALKRELMRNVRSDSRRAAGVATRGWRLPSLRPSLAWAAATVAAVALVVVGLTSGGGSTRVVAAEVATPGTHADLVIPPGSGTGATLRVSGLRAPPPGQIYEVWLQRGHDVVPASLFSVTADGRGAAGIAGSLKGVTNVMVTREVARGVDKPTRAPILVVRT